MAAPTITLAGGPLGAGRTLAAPTAQRTDWHDVADGERYSISTLLVGRSDEETCALNRAHAEAVAGIVLEALQARADGDMRRARALAAAAERLTGQVVGHNPVALTQPR
jgi:hypothetical protein